MPKLNNKTQKIIDKESLIRERKLEIFIQNLYAEISLHKSKRTTFILQKLAFITAIFGVASIQLFTNRAQVDIVVLPMQNLWILYIIPIMALAYDIYIYAEDYKVKRIGAFIRTNSIMQDTMCSGELEWQKYVEDGRREPLATYATMMLTIILSLAAFLIMCSINYTGYEYLILLIGICGSIILFYTYKYVLKDRLNCK
jgi:hypothetical protein